MTQEAIKDYCRQNFTGGAEPVLEKLHGDASYRTYYRCPLGQGRSVIIMQLPPGKSSVSEEISNLKTKPAEMPFINVARYLAELDLPVPKILHKAPDNSFLVLEDLGSQTLESQIKKTPADLELWYQRAIELLVMFQTKTALKSNCLAFERSFDATLFNWELDHFLEYGIEARYDKKLSPSQRKEFSQHAESLTNRLVQLPQTLTHRDFQSRNLMIKEGKIFLIDFQDALLGPRAYDLVALLRDSYIHLDPKTLDRLLDFYEERSGVAIRKDFWLITIQRKLKDAGRFVFIDRVKKNSSFLPYIRSSLDYVQAAFKERPELSDFYQFLKPFVPEWL